MKADLFFPVRGRISIEISVVPPSLFPVQEIHKQQVNALTGNEARGQMRFSIDRNVLTGNAQNDTAYSIKSLKFAVNVKKNSG
jgi:hypothetical protein